MTQPPCSNCGSIPEPGDIYCGDCGTPLLEVAALPVNSVGSPRCPYCRALLRPGEYVVTCQECGLQHHQDCWKENQGCSTYGCRGQASAPLILGERHTADSPGPGNLCRVCAEPREPEDRFCGFCGSRIQE